MTKHIPNFLTSLNVLCGSIAIFFAVHGELQIASILILIAAFFDFTDGFAARALKAYSDIGKELDSLADLISFGVAPAAILSNMMLQTIAPEADFFSLNLSNKTLMFFPFIMVVFAALRLAKFNIDTRQSENFLGLTTTATGIFTASFVFLADKNYNWFEQILSPYLIIGLVVVFSGLLVSEIPMFSLKFKNYKVTENAHRYLLLLAGLVLLATLGFAGISILILLYILFSVVTSIFAK